MVTLVTVGGTKLGRAFVASVAGYPLQCGIEPLRQEDRIMDGRRGWPVPIGESARERRSLGSVRRASSGGIVPWA